MKKLTYEDVKFYIEVESLSNCKLLSKEYINVNDKLTILCSCGRTYEVSFKHFKVNKQTNCRECSKTKLSNMFTKTHNTFFQQFNDLVDEEYILLGTYEKYHKRILLKHNACGSEYYVSPANFISGHRCPECNGGIKSNTIEFKEKLYKLHGDEYEVLGEYINNNTKIKIKHNCCGNVLFMRPNDILSGNKCLECSGRKTKNLDIIKSQVYELCKSEYSVEGRYKNNKSKLVFSHKICGQTFNMKVNNFLNGQRCPICSESKGEIFIRYFLDGANILFEPQKSFENLVGINNGLLSYDFYLPDYNLLIEYQGQFHDGSSGEYSKVNLNTQKEHDKRKKLYASLHNINFLEIWYWDFDKIEEILKDYLFKK